MLVNVFFVSLVYFLVLVFNQDITCIYRRCSRAPPINWFLSTARAPLRLVHFKMMATKTLSQTLPYFLKNESERKSHPVLDQDLWTGTGWLFLSTDFNHQKLNLISGTWRLNKAKGLYKPDRLSFWETYGISQGPISALEVKNSTEWSFPQPKVVLGRFLETIKV